MKPDITITETIEGYTRPHARTLTVIDEEGFAPGEVRIVLRGPKGRNFGDFWDSKVNLVNFAKEIIRAYEEKPSSADQMYLTPGEVIQLERELDG
jgi:hypothetical protein